MTVAFGRRAQLVVWGKLKVPTPADPSGPTIAAPLAATVNSPITRWRVASIGFAIGVRTTILVIAPFGAIGSANAETLGTVLRATPVAPTTAIFIVRVLNLD